MENKEKQEEKPKEDKPVEQLLQGKICCDLWTNSIYETLSHSYMLPIFEYLNKDKENKLTMEQFGTLSEH